MTPEERRYLNLELRKISLTIRHLQNEIQRLDKWLNEETPSELDQAIAAVTRQHPNGCYARHFARQIQAMIPTAGERQILRRLLQLGYGRKAGPHGRFYTPPPNAASTAPSEPTPAT